MLDRFARTEESTSEVRTPPPGRSARTLSGGNERTPAWAEGLEHGLFGDGTSQSAQQVAQVMPGTIYASPPKLQAPTQVQKQPITKQLSSVPQYEYTGKEQKQTAGKVTNIHVDLSFDPTTGQFTCTFPVKWRFPNNWPTKQRQDYIALFENTVTSAWSNRFTLVEYSGTGSSGRPTGRTAMVNIRFNHFTVPDFANETEYLKWSMKQTNDVLDRWTMAVFPTDIREEVHAPEVWLDPNSMIEQTTDVSKYLDRSYSNTSGTLKTPPYKHYMDANIPISAPRGTYRQRPAEHEFGHMLGLGDEYIVSREDYETLTKITRYNESLNKSGKGTVEARTEAAVLGEMRRRRAATQRLMNIGSKITSDYYQPFAQWLSTLTGTEWKVGSAVPQTPAKPAKAATPSTPTTPTQGTKAP